MMKPSLASKLHNKQANKIKAKKITWKANVQNMGLYLPFRGSLDYALFISIHYLVRCITVLQIIIFLVLLNSLGLEIISN